MLRLFLQSPFKTLLHANISFFKSIDSPPPKEYLVKELIGKKIYFFTKLTEILKKMLDKRSQPNGY